MHIIDMRIKSSRAPASYHYRRAHALLSPETGKCRRPASSHHHRQVRRSASAEDRHRHRSFTVKSGDRQVITTGDRHRHRRAIVHSSSSQVKLWLITTRQADTGKFSLPETASYIVTIRSGRVRDRVTHKSAGKWSLPARKSTMKSTMKSMT